MKATKVWEIKTSLNNDRFSNSFKLESLFTGMKVLAPLIHAFYSVSWEYTPNLIFSKALCFQRTETQAVCALPNGASENDQGLGKDGLELLIHLEEVNKPRMWVERLPDNSDDEAVMLSFYPQFETSQSKTSLSTNQIILLVDLSNSMKHDRAFFTAIQLACLTIMNLKENQLFNVIVFGTNYREVFDKSLKADETSKKSAIATLGKLASNFEALGGTELGKPLGMLSALFQGKGDGSNLLLRSKKEVNLKTVLMLFSDGHLTQNVQSSILRVFEGAEDSQFRLFTNGVSSSCDKHTMRLIANKAGGFFEFFDTSHKSSWMEKIKMQFKKCFQLALNKVSVQWVLHDEKENRPVYNPLDGSGLIQVPADFFPLFSQKKICLRSKWEVPLVFVF